MNVWHWLANVVCRYPYLQLLLIVNFLGTIYGYYWYRYQIAETPLHYLPFVPDSPTASLFFTAVLFLYVIGRSNPYLEAFAAVTLFKYGIWAVAAIIAGAWLQEPSIKSMFLFETIPAANWMLIFSHTGMALEALLFTRAYSFGYRHLLVVSMWIFLNDFMDYVFALHPWVHPSLNPFIPQLGFFTIWLSVLSLTIFALTVDRRHKLVLPS